MKVLQAVVHHAESGVQDFSALAAMPPDLVLAFGSVTALQAGADAIAQAFPTAHRAGCTTAGEISGKGVEDGSLVVTALKFDHAHAAQVSTVLDGMEDSFAAGRRLAPASAIWRVAEKERVNVAVCRRGYCGLRNRRGGLARCYVLRGGTRHCGRGADCPSGGNCVSGGRDSGRDFHRHRAFSLPVSRGTQRRTGARRIGSLRLDSRRVGHGADGWLECYCLRTASSSCR